MDCSIIGVMAKTTTKLALITGAARRVGREFALHLAQKGYNIAIHYSTSTEEARECQELVEKKGVRAILVQAELDDDAQMKKIIPAVNDKMGEISVLINNASVYHTQNFMDTSHEQFRNDLAVNFSAPFFLTQDFARQVNTEDGNAVVINLIDAGHNNLAQEYFLYHLSKQALYHFTLLAARSLAPKIRVNAIAPGPVLPPPGKDMEYLANVAKNSPIGVVSPPSSLARGLDYLLSSPTVTGQVMYIDSGTHLRYH